MENKNKELIISKLEELINTVKSDSTFKRYDYLKTSIREKDEIMSLIKKIKKKTQIIINKEYRMEDTSLDEEEFKKLEDELNSYIDYQEFTYLKEDINNTLQSIKSILEDNINKINS
ncbi:MAG: YlbF family regulator [Bacilli bacterium]|nr:YlbF family regulator [Bacilli bacterium]